MLSLSRNTTWLIGERANKMLKKLTNTKKTYRKPNKKIPVLQIDVETNSTKQHIHKVLSCRITFVDDFVSSATATRFLVTSF